jgi:adenosylhomocysteine nucleosidase
MRKIGIIAAMPGELKTLVRGWQTPGKNAWTGSLPHPQGDIECIAIAGGMGAAAATRACEQALAWGQLDALVSFGWAGALTCGLKPKEAVAVDEVIDARTGERFVTDYPAGQKLVTLDRVARAEEKRGLAGSYKATLVDMEAATVGRMAGARGIAFYCFKGISDGYTDRLPDFSKFIDNGGQLRMAQLLWHVALRPGYWAALKRLGENSKVAADFLAFFTQKCLKEL